MDASWAPAIITSATTLVTVGLTLLATGVREKRARAEQIAQHNDELKSAVDRERRERWENRTADVYANTTGALSKLSYAVAGLALTYSSRGMHPLKEDELKKLVNEATLDLLSQRERVRFLCTPEAWTAFEAAYENMKVLQTQQQRQKQLPDDAEWQATYGQFAMARSDFIAAGRRQLDVP